MKCPIVELRQYTLHPGERDVLIDLFDRELIEPQEALGMSIIGQFRVVDDPDRFQWIRGFADMERRKAGLTAFYTGPAWQRHKAAANATMIDIDDVLLLRPARPDSGFDLSSRVRRSMEAHHAPATLLAANICYFEEPVEGEFTEHFERSVAPLSARLGAPVSAYFVTERSPNDFPALPVREDENAFVWFTVSQSASAYAERRSALDASAEWKHELESLAGRLRRDIEVRTLSPTTRSLLR